MFLRCIPVLICLLTGTGCRTMQTIGGGVSRAGDGMQTGAQRLGSGVRAGAGKVGAGVQSGARAVSKPVVFGARKIAGGAAGLWIWNRDDAPPQENAGAAPAAIATAPENEKALPTAHPFPKTGLLVTNAELGADATRLQATSVTLSSGWEIRGDDIAYHLEPGYTDPVALRVLGKPATAAAVTAGEGSAAGTSATADEFHYHSASGVLVLRGNPSLSTGGSRVTATGPGALIKIHLASGAISFEGAVRWSSG